MGHDIKAVCVVHNETSTGSVTNVSEIRKAIDAVAHPALLMVDTISGLASLEFEFYEWRVDVCVAGSQKGLMQPSGLSFNGVSENALQAFQNAGLQKSYWDWQEMIGPKASGFLPYTLRQICSTS